MLNRFNFKIILNLWFCFNFAMILAFNPSDSLKCSPEEKACMEKVKSNMVWTLCFSHRAQSEIFLKLNKNLESWNKMMDFWKASDLMKTWDGLTCH